MARTICPVCNKEYLVEPSGARAAKILFVSDYPGREEVNKGYCLVGDTGAVIERELTYVGIPSGRCLFTNVYWHRPEYKNDKPIKDACYKASILAVIELMRTHPYVMLAGSEAVYAFTQTAVMQLSGLVVDSPLFPEEVVLAMAMPNPASLRKGSVGEVRLSLARFREKLKKVGAL